MSQRLKYFALVSLLGALVMIVVFIGFFNQLSRDKLEYDMHLNSVVAANTLVNALTVDGMMDLIHAFSQADPATLQQSAVIERMDRLIKSYIANTGVYKIKMYSPEGLVVYSTDRDEIGRQHVLGTDFRTALNGRIHSELVRKNEYNASDREFVTRDVYETYVGVKDTDNRVYSVFEIYTDATDSVARMMAFERWIMVGVTVLVGLFYAGLYLLFYRADRALKRESGERERLVQRLHRANDELEIRVRERTEDLEAARYYLQSILDGIADPILVIDKDLVVMDMNAAARELVPSRACSNDMLHCYQLSHRRDIPCDGQDHPCAFSEVLKTGSTVKLLHKHFGASGEEMYVAVTSSPLRNAKGEMLGIIEVEHDVSDVVRARNHLELSEERTRAVMDTVSDSILSVGDDGRIKHVNKSATSMFGYLRDEFEGMLFGDLLEDDALDQVECQARQYLQPMVSQGAREVHAKHKHGDLFPAELWVGLLEMRGMRDFIVVIHDISSQKAREKELEQARQQAFHQEKMAAIGQLAAGILHEVGNPIAAISGVIQAIQWEGGEGARDARLMEQMAVIETHVNRLAGITREIADFASPTPAARQLLDLNALIRGTVNLMRYDKRFRVVRFELDLDPALPACHGVADQITQVLMNLLLNAADAYEETPQDQRVIEIASAMDVAYIHVTIRDHGRGMTPETRFRALDTFFSTKPPGKGTGLGLSLCDSIMANHGGRLEFESEPGKGAVIHLFFPLEDIDS
ncbi:MAG TPA: PAS domain S-box protein [Gammaproteobacteria bacterium]|nr:PAS domain S-box protein [Gammaproteobacteria bacterium]